MIKVDEDTLELKRQLIHLLNGCFIAFMVYTLRPIIGNWILAPLFIALILLHLLPKIAPHLKVMKVLMHHFERRRDIKDFPFKGAIFFGWGIMFPIILLDAPYAAAVILILSVGDSVSTLIGRRYGRIKIGGKSFEGSLAFFLSSLACCVVIIDPYHAFALCLAGTLIELFSFFDDNIIIPASLSLLAKYLLP